MKKPKIIVLCGSTRFIKLFDAMMLKFTLEGNIVLSVGTHYTKDHGSVWADKKEMLDELHKRKIDLADLVYVINKDGYIGDSTRSEIEYAREHNKPIEYMEGVIRTADEFHKEIMKQHDDLEKEQYLHDREGMQK